MISAHHRNVALLVAGCYFMTNADLSPPPRSMPLFSGDASSSSGTTAIIPPETGTGRCPGLQRGQTQ